jgi:hypothetical protein
MGNSFCKKIHVQIPIEEKPEEYEEELVLGNKIEEEYEGSVLGNKIEEESEEEELILDDKLEEELILDDKLEEERNTQKINNKYMKLIIKNKADMIDGDVKRNKIIFYDSRLKKKITSKIEYKIHRKSIIKFI